MGSETDREKFEAKMAAKDVPLIQNDADAERFREMMARPRKPRTLPPPLPLDEGLDRG